MMQKISNRNFQLALNTATLGHNLEGYGAGWSPERIVDECAARGLAGIVFWRREIGDRAVEIGELVRSAGMQVVGLCRSPFLVGPDLSEAIIDEMKSSIDMAAALGTQVLTIVSGGTEPGTKGILESQKILADRIASVAGYAKDRHVNLALEPLNPMFGGNRTCMMTVRDAINVYEMVDASNVGIAIDVYHVWWDSTLEDSLMDAGADRLLGYHLCDWLEQTNDMLLDRGMMGDGVADLKSIGNFMQQAGFQGCCEVEIFSADNWWRRPPSEVLDIMIDRFQTVC